MTETNHEALYEVLSDGRPKYQMMWTNHTKQFFIDGKEVEEAYWVKQVQDYKEKK